MVEYGVSGDSPDGGIKLNKMLIAVCALTMMLGADIASAGHSSAVVSSADRTRSVHDAEVAADGVSEAPIEGPAEDLAEDLVEEPSEGLADGTSDEAANGSADDAGLSDPDEQFAELRPAAEPADVLSVLEEEVDAASEAYAPSASSVATMQAEVVRLTNDRRKSKGLPALKTDPRLHSVAQTWSGEQAKTGPTGKMFHNPILKSQIPAGWSWYGENVAAGQNSAERVVQAWWDSKGHKANILHREFTHIGVGIAYSSTGRAYYTQVFVGYPRGLAEPGVFTDVSPGAPFYKEITWMQKSGLSKGTATPAGPVYHPKSSVSRAAMAAFLFRLKTPKGSNVPAGYTVPPRSPFADVSTAHPFYKEIAWMSTSGISKGYAQRAGNPRYNPQAAVSRAAMAAFLFRMERDKKYKLPPSPRFSDVRANHVYYREISWMFDSKVSSGINQASGKPKYEPNSKVSRQAMAAFLYRLKH